MHAHTHNARVHVIDTHTHTLTNIIGNHQKVHLKNKRRKCNVRKRNDYYMRVRVVCMLSLFFLLQFFLPFLFRCTFFFLFSFSTVSTMTKLCLWIVLYGFEANTLFLFVLYFFTTRSAYVIILSLGNIRNHMSDNFWFWQPG